MRHVDTWKQSDFFFSFSNLLFAPFSRVSHWHFAIELKISPEHLITEANAHDVRARVRDCFMCRWYDHHRIRITMMTAVMSHKCININEFLSNSSFHLSISRWCILINNILKLIIAMWNTWRTCDLDIRALPTINLHTLVVHTEFSAGEPVICLLSNDNSYTDNNAMLSNCTLGN